MRNGALLPETQKVSSMNTTSYSGGVAVTADGVIGRIEFWSNKGNALSYSVLTELAVAVRELSARTELTAISLSSRGDGAFCGGAYLEETKGEGAPPADQNVFSGFADLILALTRSPKIVVARVHGKIVGGGVGVVSACDLAVAFNEASVRLSELSLGLGPFVIGPAVERRIGRASFGALSLDGLWRDASWGERHGLFSFVETSIESVDARVLELETRFRSYQPEVIANWKKLLWSDTEHWEALLPARAKQVTEIAHKRSI
ncbi:MAG: enoyl-CoA hydratase/isomerase family protein [Deltaproteobacteria bacterium]|nr:enoyl-CoA hydratase/isomerase family protein [Deltaproteobacteria bacterium]